MPIEGVDRLPPIDRRVHARGRRADYAVGFTVLELVRGLRGSGGTDTPEYRRLLGEYLSSLPAHAYSNAAAIFPQMIGKEDEDFEYGLRAILKGIRSMGPGADEP